MKNLLILTLILLGSCGELPKEIDWVDGFTNELLEEQIRAFEDDFGVTIDYEVVFVEYFSVDSDAKGVCIESARGTKRVEILEYFADKANLLKVLAYHEFGHCSLDLDHYKKDRDIMNPKVSTYMLYDFDFYIQKIKDRL